MFHWVPNTSPIMVSEYVSVFSIITFTFNKSSSEAVAHRCFLQILQYSQEKNVLESLCNKVAGFKACKFIKKSPTQLFSYEYCKIFKNFFYRTHSVTAF